MRRRMLLGAAVAGVALALASGAGAQTVAQDSVVVTGAPVAQAGSSFTEIAINATSDPSGGNPTGRVTFAIVFSPGVGFPVDGPVTCLSVSGNTATINVQDQAFGFGIVTVHVVDEPDSFVAGPVGRAPTDCSPPIGWIDIPLSGGDVAIRDALPLPTSKDQCKRGGWREYGFKNQGECVSFVSRGGKSPIAGSLRP
jgi:hypothetical protein